MTNDETFIKITNKDIYQKLCNIEAKLVTTQAMSKKAQIISTTALTITLIVLGYFISSLL